MTSSLPGPSFHDYKYIHIFHCWNVHAHEPKMRSWPTVSKKEMNVSRNNADGISQRPVPVKGQREVVLNTETLPWAKVLQPERHPMQ